MTILEPITLSDIDEYIADLTILADRAKSALSCGLRARMAVSAGAQKIAYGYLAKVGTLLTEIYQAGGREADSHRKYPRSKPRPEANHRPRSNRRPSRDKG
jgi:hypothetical protein